MILLYASPHEVKYVNAQYGLCVGLGAKYIRTVRRFIADEDRVILFGSCGSLMPMRNLTDLKSFWIPEKWFYNGDSIKCYGGRGYGLTVDESLKCTDERLQQGISYDVVDMESYHVGKVCEELGAPFLSVRYIMDGCDRKITPFGVNWAFRKYQHRRMQLKFNKWMEVCHV